MSARKISIAFFSAGAALLFLTTLLPLPLDWKLSGVEIPAPRPSLSLHDWFSGKSAQMTEAYLSSKFGVRGWAIRLSHQLSWIFFRQLPELKGTGIVIGKEGMLFEKAYVDHVEKQIGAREPAISEFAGQILALQKKLKPAGIPVVVCLSPAKPTIYEEFLPDGTAFDKRFNNTFPARETCLRIFREKGVPLVDAKELLRARKSEGVPLFPKSGTHWNHYGAALVMEEIWKLARLQNPSLPQLPRVIGYMEAPAAPTDNDLGRLFNMLFCPYRTENSPKPLFSTEAPPEKKLRILGVGDSFSFQLIDLFGMSGVVEEYKLLYYNRGLYRFTFDTPLPQYIEDTEVYRTASITPRGYDLSKMIDGYDIILIELNEIFIKSYAWGFSYPNLP